jgi:predicted Rossmann fold nucleotide-binding protein DprA/Smf involved in DNA uptake
MNTMTFSDDAMAILLLCADFGRPNGADVTPLSLKDYNRLAFWLKGKGYSPKDLVAGPALECLRDEAGHTIEVPRLERLLSRGAGVAFAVERWTNKGIWIVCRSDDTYPKRLRRHLTAEAPPILYGIGHQHLMNEGGLAIVGSRNVDQPGFDFTVKSAARAVEQGLAVISGGARGVDQTAMQSALEADGSVIGVLADSLLKKSLQPETREAVKNGRLVLLSPVHPESGWKVYQAMNRNKIIYGLSDVALVISADLKKGGTWQGAEEELRRHSRIPVFVRSGQYIPDGNRELLKRGGIALDDRLLLQTFSELIARIKTDAAMIKEPEQGSLFGAETHESEPETESRQTIPEQSSELSVRVSKTYDKPEAVFDAVLPILIESLNTPRKPDDLAKELRVVKNQIDQWLNKAHERGDVKKLTKPVRFVAAEKSRENPIGK